MAQRTAEEIRASIEANRVQLQESVEVLRGEVTALTDWRAHVERNREKILVGAAIAGFVLGGGLAALGGIRRRKNRR
jgi:hypothetical protein